MSHYALSGSVTRELKEISVIFPKTQVTDLLGALIEWSGVEHPQMRNGVGKSRSHVGVLTPRSDLTPQSD
jgi:hypothetical protein